MFSTFSVCTECFQCKNSKLNDNVNILDFKAPEFKRLEEAVRERDEQLETMNDIVERVTALEKSRPTWETIIQ